MSKFRRAAYLDECVLIGDCVVYGTEIMCVQSLFPFLMALSTLLPSPRTRNTDGSGQVCGHHADLCRADVARVWHVLRGTNRVAYADLPLLTSVGIGLASCAPWCWFSARHVRP